MRRLVAVPGLALALAACSAQSRAPESAALPPDPYEIAHLTDTNPDPRVVEVSVAAAPAQIEYLTGKPADVWAYRDAAIAGSKGTIPGPMLVANQGDDVIVHFTNELPESTTLHWHGIRLDNTMDGSTSTQQVVMPGASFDYRFKVKDAGSFWFHPHVRGDVQIERGLYAPLVVRGDESVLDVTAERYLVVDDVKVTSDGRLSTDTDEMDTMMGRQGNVLLVNGKRMGELRVQAGGRERWRIVNAANGRFFKLRLAGHAFTVVGSDGGFVPAPYRTEELLVAPGERYDVTVDLPGAEGTRVALQTVYYDRGHDMPDPGPKPMLDVVYGPRVTRPLAPIPATLGAVAPLPVTPATLARRMELREVDATDGPRFYINDQYWPFNTPLMVKQGDLEIWEIVNTAAMDHPFHIHGMFFQPLDARGQPDLTNGWKDTVNVKQKSTLKLAVRYEALGMWMFHCHILEHAERGMMGDLMIMK